MAQGNDADQREIILLEVACGFAVGGAVAGTEAVFSRFASRTWRTAVIALCMSPNLRMSASVVDPLAAKLVIKADR